MPQTPFIHRQPKSWKKVSLTVPEKYSDSIASFLADLNNSAVEQSTIMSAEHSVPMDVVTVYLEEGTKFATSWEHLQAFLTDLEENNEFTCSIQTEQIIEEDWNKRWKEHFKPFHLSKRLVIKPSWEEYTTQNNEVVLEMDPGMAFGTGLHASTRLALQLTEELFNTTKIHSVLDVGTGTGILGMSCALFGAETIIGIDNDMDARTAAADNVVQNNLNNKMTVINKDLTQISQKFDLVIANITQDVLTFLANSLVSCVKQGGNLILSGILTGKQASNIEHIFHELGFTTFKTKDSEEWTALHMIAPQ